jgi:hypothetical protein
MQTRFTDEDVGKRVCQPNGGEVGVVVDVVDGGDRARVEPDEGLAGTVASALGWGDETVHELPVDEVETVTDDAVRLRRRR